MHTSSSMEAVPALWDSHTGKRCLGRNIGERSQASYSYGFIWQQNNQSQTLPSGVRVGMKEDGRHYAFPGRT